MDTFDLGVVLKRISESQMPEVRDLEFVLSRQAEKDLEQIFNFADGIRKEFSGEGILLRGIVEFANFCRNSCYYCGLNKNNLTLKRYRLTTEEVLSSIKKISKAKIKTVVLQSGEDDDLGRGWLAEIIREIKSKFDMAVTLSVGERSEKDYRAWKDAGADRYLLKIETSNKKLYESLHPKMSFENRLNCLKVLKDLDYQVGSGSIIGLKGQTLEILAQDIQFFKKNDFDMIGIGPFIAHPATELKNQAQGDALLTLKVLALTRMVTKRANLPATTALGSLNRDFRLEGLKAGANVIMPNFTPLAYCKLYEIYPNKKCLEEKEGACVNCFEQIAKSLGRFIDYSRGDAQKKFNQGE